MYGLNTYRCTLQCIWHGRVLPDYFINNINHIINICRCHTLLVLAALTEKAVHKQTHLVSDGLPAGGDELLQVFRPKVRHAVVTYPSARLLSLQLVDAALHVGGDEVRPVNLRQQQQHVMTS